VIIDVNAALGPYPFRRLPRHEAGELARQMDRSGIARAVVTWTPAVFYRDTHRGNEELRAALAPHGARFVPVATINPAYAGWERDLGEAVETWKMKAVALWPEHHGYALNDARGRAALARIAALGVPVRLAQRLEDRRQRHAWDKAEDLTPAALIEAARAHPTLKFLLVNWLNLDGAKLAEAGLRGRVLIDFARLQVVFRKEVPRLIDALGAEAIAFGSHAPFDYVGPSLVKLENIQLTRPADHEKIARGNAVRFLGLAP
jgi:predicted TIM-barrel fold metal-dependent hydrolase